MVATDTVGSETAAKTLEQGLDSRESAAGFHGVFKAKTIGDLEKVYDQWAETFDKTVQFDLSGDGVNHPTVELMQTLKNCKAEEILFKRLKNDRTMTEKTIALDHCLNILDCGAGTGAAGKLIKEDLFGDIYYKGQGKDNIPRINLVAFDLSQGMLDKCDRSFYDALAKGACPDMSAAVQALGVIAKPTLGCFENCAKYDLTFCAGTFTPNHAPPTTLQKLVEITNTNGLISFSIRTYFYEDETSGFKKEIERLSSEKKWIQIACEERIYLPKENVSAKYFVFQVIV